MQLCEKLCQKIFHIHSVDNSANQQSPVQNVQLINKTTAPDEQEHRDSAPSLSSQPNLPDVIVVPENLISSQPAVLDAPDNPTEPEPQTDTPEIEKPESTMNSPPQNEAVLVHKEDKSSSEITDSKNEDVVLEELDNAIAQSDDIVLEMKTESEINSTTLVTKIETEEQEQPEQKEVEPESTKNSDKDENNDDDNDDDDDDLDSDEDDEDDEDDENMDKNSKRLANKYGDLGGELLILYIPNPRLSRCSFGMRLSGNKDLNRMSIFVCQIVSNSLADIDGRIQIGDEILEIDDHILYGRSHVNASPIIKSSSEKMIKFVIHRSSNWHEDMAVPVAYKYAEELLSNPSSRRSSVLEPVGNTSAVSNDNHRKLSSVSLGQMPCGSTVSTEETHIVYLTKGAQGLGFAIMEGSFTNEPGIYIKHMAPMGPAAKDGSFKPGDRLTSINNHDVTNSSYDSVLEILRNTRGQVRLVVSRIRCATIVGSSNGGTPTKDPSNALGDSVGSMPEGGLAPGGNHYKKRLSAPNISIGAMGFTSRSRSPTIAEEPIIYNSADDDKDTLLIPAITTINKNTPSSSPSKISIKVSPESESGLNNYAKAMTDTKSRRKSSIVTMEPPSELVNVIINSIQDDEDVDNVTIQRNNRPLGLLIIGGCDTYIGDTVVHDIFPGGAIAEDNRIKVGDRILMINQQSLVDKTHAQITEMLLNATQQELNFKVRHQNPKQQAAVGNKSVAVTLQGSNGDKDKPEDLGNTDRHRGSITTLLPLNEDQDLYEEVTTLELVKKPSKGLGISVIGREGARGVYICDIVKGGVADVDGRLRSGDQILEINGDNMRPAKQEEAAMKLKSLMGNVILKIGRLQNIRMKYTPSYLIPRDNDNDNLNTDKLNTKTLSNNHHSGAHTPAARSPLASPAHAR